MKFGLRHIFIMVFFLASSTFADDTELNCNNHPNLATDVVELPLVKMIFNSEKTPCVEVRIRQLPNPLINNTRPEQIRDLHESQCIYDYQLCPPDSPPVNGKKLKIYRDLIDNFISTTGYFLAPDSLADLEWFLPAVLSGHGIYPGLVTYWTQVQYSPEMKQYCASSSDKYSELLALIRKLQMVLKSNSSDVKNRGPLCPPYL